MELKNPILYINHSPKDNVATNNKPGWTESFAYVLGLMINQLKKNEVKLELAGENSNKPSDYHVLINVLSTDFLNDSDCKKVAEDNKKPVFDIYKEPISELSYSNFNYDFFDSVSDEKINTWDPELESEHARDFWMRVVDLSYDISSQLSQEKVKGNKVVYIAESNPEQRFVREAIKRDLKRHGYDILPEENLPNEEKTLKQNIENSLKNASLSIHLLGDKYGDKVIKKKLSKVDFQNKIASEFCKNNPNKLRRIIWLSPDHKNTDLEQNEYLEYLRKNKDELTEAELIQTPIEILKSIALSYLGSGSSNGVTRKKSTKKSYQMINDGGIYIIHDAADKKDVASIVEWFKKNNLEPLTPDFDLRHDQLMLDHKEKLVKCDAVLIYCNHGNIQWSKTKIKDLIKAPGFGRKREFKFKSIYIGSKQNQALKDQVDGSDFTVIENMDRFSASMMSPLLSKVK